MIFELCVQYTCHSTKLRPPVSTISVLSHINHFRLSPIFIMGFSASWGDAILLVAFTPFVLGYECLKSFKHHSICYFICNEQINNNAILVNHKYSW